VRVSPATHTDLSLIRRFGPPADSAAFMQTEAGFNSLLGYARGKPLEPSGPPPNAPASEFRSPALSSLHLVSDIDPPVVTVRGSVVLTSPALYVEDSTGGIAVDLIDGPALKIGDEVEATGRVEPHRFSAVLRQAAVRMLWARGPAPPLSVTASQAAAGSFDGRFIEVEGYLHDKSRAPGQALILNLQSEHQTFRAVISGKRQDLSFDRLQVNSLLRLRGISVVDSRYTENLTPFVLLLRSSDDVEVVSGPPWWDKQHLVTIAFSLLIAAFISFSLYTRAEHWRLRAVLEERSRMAREIHDTLAQGFAGIALQLEVAQRESQPPASRATGALGMALQMARQSRGEAHRSIAALRTLHTDEPLAGMLQKVLAPQVAGSGLQLHLSVSGNPQRLTQETEGQILRIAQESLANTVQHARATRVDLRLVFGEKELLMEIADDGHGFEVLHAPSADDGHFGLTGMQERAVRIQGTLAIRSTPRGTIVCLRMPLPRRRSLGWWTVSEFAGRFLAM
jgi:signal transduction histidine kinase